MKEWFEREKQKLEGYSKAEKAEYIWRYYKLWIIGIISAVVIVVYVAVIMLTGVDEQNIYVAFVSAKTEIGGESDFQKGYASYTDTDLKKEAVTFDTGFYLDLSKGLPMGDTYFQKLVVLLDSGTVDAVVMEKDNLETFAETGRLIDLSNDKTKALMDKYSDRIIIIDYTDEEGNQMRIPVGIDVSDSILVTQENAYESSCVLGISGEVEHVEAVTEFLSYILGE